MYIVGEILETRKDHLFHPKYENLSFKIKVDRVWKAKTERIIWLPRIVSTDLCGEMEIVIGKKYLFKVIKAENKAAIFDDCASSGFIEGATDALKYLSTKPSWTYSEK